MKQNHELILKTVFVGQPNSGKTSLLERETRNSFKQEFVATIGVDFRIKEYIIGGIKVRMQYWDTAGQQRFRSIQKPYYRGSSAVCLCFDLSDKTSFNHLLHWVDQIKLQNVEGTVFLIGCKSDLDSQVPTDEILTFAEAYQLKYFQTSAKMSQGVNEGFRYMVEYITQRQIQNLAFAKNKQIHVQEKKIPNKKTCCS